MVSIHYSEANNPYIDNFDPHKPMKYLISLDANSFYGYSQCQYLPVGNFSRLNEQEIIKLDISSLSENSPTG